jgi:RHH-type proline utilization regulon transcriptional repressor/proline dehydrogenase/delta 1-pyrroline-5-carboxylate dehydrogenase
MPEGHARDVVRGAKWHHRLALPAATQRGTFVAPLAVQIESIATLQREWFGPILHVVSYRSRDLEQLIDSINAKSSTVHSSGSIGPLPASRGTLRASVRCGRYGRRS